MPMFLFAIYAVGLALAVIAGLIALRSLAGLRVLAPLPLFGAVAVAAASDTDAQPGDDTPAG